MKPKVGGYYKVIHKYKDKIIRTEIFHIKKIIDGEYNVFIGSSYEFEADNYVDDWIMRNDNMIISIQYWDENVEELDRNEFILEVL